MEGVQASLERHCCIAGIPSQCLACTVLQQSSDNQQQHHYVPKVLTIILYCMYGHYV